MHWSGKRVITRRRGQKSRTVVVYRRSTPSEKGFAYLALLSGLTMRCELASTVYVLILMVCYDHFSELIFLLINGRVHLMMILQEAY
jgi:hypothetical protein